MNDVLQVVIGIAAPLTVIVGVGWIFKWQAKPRNEERQTDTPITGETRVSIPVSTARFEAAFRLATEQSADKLRREMREMEIRPCEPVVQEYTIKVTGSELSAIATIAREFAQKHSAMPGFKTECNVAEALSFAIRNKDRI